MLMHKNVYYHQLRQRVPQASVNFENDVIEKLCKPEYDQESLEILRSSLAEKNGLILLQYESGGCSAVTPYVLQPDLQKAQQCGYNFAERILRPRVNFAPAIKQQLIKHLEASLAKGQPLHKALGYDSHEECVQSHAKQPELLLKITSALESGFSISSIMGVKAGLESAIDGDLINMWDRDAMRQCLAFLAVRLDPELGKGLNIDPDAWKKLLIACLTHHYRYLWRFTNIIKWLADGRNMNLWPHIMYNAVSLNELDKEWGYAQIDALSMILFVLFFALNHKDSQGVPLLEWNDAEIQPMAEALVCVMHAFFDTVQVWQGFDKGAWEDVSAQHASSIGCAVVMMREQLAYVLSNGSIFSTQDGQLYGVTKESISNMMSKCMDTLNRVLPNEFCQSEFDPDASQGKVRPYDIALLNPMVLAAWSGTDFISADMDLKIINGCIEMLMGPHGFMRYMQPFFDVWDGRTNRPDLKQGRTAMESEGANWTHPAGDLSLVMGEKFERLGGQFYGDGQIYHFNQDMAGFDRREATGNLRETWNKPEAWIVHPVTREWVADANVPLAWSTAGSLTSIARMRRRVSGQKPKIRRRSR